MPFRLDPKFSHHMINLTEVQYHYAKGGEDRHWSCCTAEGIDLVHVAQGDGRAGRGGTP